MSDNEQIILAGRELKEMRDQNPGFQRLKAELKERLENYQHKVLAFKDIGSSQAALPYYLYRFQALDEIMGWIDDEISRGQRALQDQISRQSDRTRKETHDGPPNQRQPEEINA